MKLIAIDLDGTLLNKDHSISSKNLDALHKASRRHIVAISTGRAAMDVYTLLGNADSLPVIASNGATIYDHKGKLLDETPLCQETVLAMMAYADQQHLYYELTTRHHLLSPTNGEKILKNELNRAAKHLTKDMSKKAWARAQVQFAQAGWKPCCKINEFVRSGHTVYKFLVFSYNADALVQFKQHFRSYPNVCCMNAVGYTLEFNASRIDKGKGVQILADHYGIDRKHIIAIGDSQNDLPMFRVASIKVAMGNAISLIKARSSFITLDCDHDGVAYSMAHQLSLFS